MRVLRWSLQLHKWIALIVGVQVLFWVAGGLVMTAIPIEKVRGEHHAAERAPAALPASGLLSPQDAARAAGLTSLSQATLGSTPRGPVWTLTAPGGEPVIVSARDGRPLPALTETEAARLAAAAYRGDGKPVSTRLLPQAPAETGKSGPLWRVDFDDAENTAFYLSPQTGEVVSRRSELWRFYDLFWRLHVMDWQNGEDFNHPLIVLAAFLTLVITVTGFVLLWIRLARDWTVARTRG